MGPIQGQDRPVPLKPLAVGNAVVAADVPALLHDASAVS